MRLLAIALLAVVLALPVGAALSQTPLERAMVALINHHRTVRHLAPMHPNALLWRSARIKSRDMVQGRYFDHYSPSGDVVFTRARRLGYDWLRIGEAIAWGSGPYATAQSIITAWMGSPEHRAILLGPYRDEGLSCVTGAPVTPTAPPAITCTLEAGTR